jgi:tetratricopeptide (TPR) repeat protein
MKYDLEDHQGAFADFSEAIRLQSNDPDVYYGRGLIRFQQGKYQDAILDYEEALCFYEQQGNVKRYFELLKDIETIKNKHKVFWRWLHYDNA